MNRRRLFAGGLTLLAATALMGLSGCSSTYTLNTEVASFGSWAAPRQPGSYTFDRLPSQQQAGDSADLQSRIEDSARAALSKAGFSEASDPKAADYLISLGVRINAQDRSPWDDPLWWRWHGSYSAWRYGYGPGAWPRRGAHPFYSPTDMMLMERRFERSVALLVRERQTLEPLFEARASSEGNNQGDMELISAMFGAALSGFPQVDPKPRRVSVMVGTPSPVK